MLKIPMRFTIREARPEDVSSLDALIACSARGLGRADYTDAQIEAALGGVWGVDTTLIRDGTYFVAEAAGEMVAGGGWSRRRTLFGGDNHAARQSELLDPAVDAARIRAFFVRPDWARRGIGRVLLQTCEEAARTEGFRAAELMATLPGQRLYQACGYVAGSPVDYPLGGGVSIRFVPMRKNLTPAQAPTLP